MDARRGRIRCWPVPLTLTLSPNWGAGGGTDRIACDVVISLEAARWLYFYVKEM